MLSGSGNTLRTGCVPPVGTRPVRQRPDVFYRQADGPGVAGRIVNLEVRVIADRERHGLRALIHDARFDG